MGVSWIAGFLVALSLSLAPTADETPGSIEGRVVDQEGTLLAVNWTILVNPIGRSESGHATGSTAGRFRIDDLPPGFYRITAQHPAGGQVSCPDTLVRSAETVTVEMVWTGPPLQGWIRVEFESPDELPFLTPDLERVVLVEVESGATLGRPRLRAIRGPAFEGLADREYVVRLEQDGYESWTSPPVRPGPSVEVVVPVRGTARLRFEVVDATRHTPVEHFSADGYVADPSRDTRYDGEFWLGSLRGLLVSEGPHPGGMADIEGVVPGDWVLTFTAPGFQDEALRVESLRSGESRTILVELRAPATVEGSVVDPGGAPLADVPVGLYAPRTEGELPETYFHTLETDWSLMQPGPWVHSERLVTWTDADGHFRLEGVGAGKWFVRAYRSPTVHALGELFDIGDDGALRDLELVLPRGVDLEGRLVAPEGASFAGMTAWVWPMRGEQSRAFPLSTPVDADGTFRLGPFGPGEIAVWLAVTTDWQPVNMAWQPGQYDPPEHLAGRYVVGADALVQTFDLREIFPARVAVQALVNDAPAAGAWVQLFGEESGVHLATAAADEQGRAVLGPFFVTRARPFVAAGDGSWWAFGEHIVTPPPAGLAEATVSVRIIEGSALLLDRADGRSLAEEVVCLYQRTPHGWTTRPLRTDAEGRLPLRLPPSDLAVVHVGSAGDSYLPPPGTYGTHFGPPPWPEEPDDQATFLEWPGDSAGSPTLRVVRRVP